MIVAIVALTMLLVALTVILRPLVAPDEEPLDDAPDLEALEAKEAEKERALDAIRDLDMDFATLKLSEDDYRRLRSQHMAEAGRLIVEIDAQFVEPAPASPSVAGSTTPTSLGRESGAPDRSDRSISRPDQSADPSCSTCGLRHYAGDRFCRLCGRPLTQ